MRLDDIDRRIVACLLENARASFAQIGDEVGLSAPAVKRRVDRLRHDGVITGYAAVVDPSALGWTTEAFVELFCAGRTSPDEISASIRRHPEVVAAYTITGEANALVHLRAHDIQALEQALERLRNEPNIVQTKTSIVLSRLLGRPNGGPDA
ncbi:Lrp/AsnC family transcriptional regulator [Actinoallomurus rhizosphaericola]|uniref:Lrp/AsnC family transcriptional regulator n=1 Tax=Actinoallomurus rhizosphaericola TaxID=2952536 RepID=UPI002091C50B|nr:Lrp/AsnC family transcriptional regulator [Actinoallomurus rhizosphaericola]MCO5992620.1 Lrp/AsnC family transcriptional regulator [Actinoallomurus rhizosphaericola]